MSNIRTLSPQGNLTDTARYVVQIYYPERNTCDISPIGTQRGILSDVPIRLPYSGAWEIQTQHNPKVGGNYDVSQFGNAARGPRWGVSFPVEPGDIAIVEYEGGGQSDPVIVGFASSLGGYGIPWMANQVLSKESDYTRQTPDDDDLMTGRFDLLLPSGAWQRSTKSGSWTIATAPVDRPRAFITLHGDGNVKIKARDKDEYTVHVEFDPNTNYGRIALGSLEDGSLIEFKDGNITIKAEKSLILKGSQISGDARPQTSGSAMDTLTSVASAAVPDADLPGLVGQAAGEQVLQSVAAIAPSAPGVIVVTTQTPPTPAALILKQLGGSSGLFSSLLSNPAIDGALRGRIGDVLSNPSGLLDGALETFKGSLPNDLAIGGAIGQLLGADALTGGLGSLTSKLDLTSLPMIKELGIPSWVGSGIQAAIAGGTPLGIGLAIAPELLDSDILDKVCQFVGGGALDGLDANGARALLTTALDELPSGLRNRVNDLLPLLDSTPMRIPRTDGKQNWEKTAAQRAGKMILKGQNLLGGPVNLLDTSRLDALGLASEKLNRIRRVSGQVEQFASNPHGLVDSVPSALTSQLPSLAAIPPEIREAISKIPQSLIGRLPNLASGLLGRLEGAIFKSDDFDENAEGCSVYTELVEEFLTSSLPSWLPEERELGSLIQSATTDIQRQIQDLPLDLLEELSGLPVRDFQSLLQNPQSLIDGLDTGMITSLFGGMTSPESGVFDVRVQNRATFGIMPQGSKPAPDLGSDVFHKDTQATPIERSQGYGKLAIAGWKAD